MPRDESKMGTLGLTLASVSPAPASTSPQEGEETRRQLAQGGLCQTKPFPGAEDAVRRWDEPGEERCSDPISARGTMSGQHSSMVKSCPAPQRWVIWGKLRSPPSRAEVMGDNIVPGFTPANTPPHFFGVQNHRNPDFPHHPPPRSLL